MPIKPGKDEKQDAWMSRCVPEMMGQNGGQKRPQEQAVAACMSMWREEHGGKTPPKKTNKGGANDPWGGSDDDDNGDSELPTPRDDEDEDDYMDRCTDAGGDESECRAKWNEAQGNGNGNGEEGFHNGRTKKDDDNGDKDKPYGDVEYADPGYQKDGKKRYPLDTEAHIRAAWSYINMPKNQEAYSADQVKKIKARIVAAWKKKIDPDGPPSHGDKGIRIFVRALSDDAPDPEGDESHSEFMLRCMNELMGGESGDDEIAEDDAREACQLVWDESSDDGQKAARRKRRLKNLSDEAPDPDENESQSEYMERCMEELGDAHDDAEENELTEACALAWDAADPYADFRKNARREGLKVKTHAGTVNNMEFILSDETPDRMGDVIMATGWDLKNFKNNPIALFNHRSDFPIGKWHNLRIVGKALRGHLELAPEGTSERIDEIRKLIDAGILKAVSVGFKPIEEQPRKTADGMHHLGLTYVKSELVETSLVSVPANPNALQVARSLDISSATLDLVFAKHGTGNAVVRRGLTGKHAETSRNGGSRQMSLAQRIIDAQGNLNGLRDQLTEHLKNVDDTNVSDAQLEITTELNERIARAEKGLGALREAEQRLATDGAPRNDGNGDGSHEIRLPVHRIASPGARPFTLPSPKKLEAPDFLWRSLTVMVKHFQARGAKSMADIMREEYGDDEGTRAVLSRLVTRNPAASAPAMTTQAGWAQELVAIIMGEFFKALIPMAVFPRVAAKGTSFTFGRAGVINLPMRSITPTISGSFVGEGAPIPVRQGQFQTQQMTPKKMAVITTFTREIAEHSTPAIEGILRDALLEDTSIAIDTVLLDNNPATTIRPAGLLNGVTGLTATSGGGFTALLGDLKQLVNAVLVATRGNLRNPVWICSPALAVSIALTPTTGAQALPFRDEVSQGTLLGFPIVESTTVPMGTLILVDGADFASVTGDDPRFEVSDQAVLHMEDTTPLAIGTPGSPATVAAPARSLWQTDTIGIRMIMPMNWVLRRPTSIAYTSAVTWQ